MPEQVLVFRITARDDASKVFREVKSGVVAVDQAVIAGNKAVATSGVAAEKAVKGVGAAATKAMPGIGTMRGALGSLAFVTAGLPGQLGSVASLLAAFSFGTLTSLGIFAGIYGIAKAFQAITKDSREAKEKLEEFLKLDPTGALAKRQEFDLRNAGMAERKDLQFQLQALLPAGKRREMEARVKELTDRENAFLDRDAKAREDGRRRGRELLEREAEEQRKAALAARDLREELAEEQRSAVVAAREYFAEQKKLRDEETRIRLDANRELRGVLFGAPGGAGVASARAATSLFGGGAPELALGMGRPGGPGALAGARKTLTGELGRIQNETFDAIAESARGVTEKMESAFEGAAAAVERGGVNMVSAMSLAANALAGLITGNQSALGSLGGITSGLSGLFSGAAAGGLAASLATPLGIAGIGLGFLDAITSSRSKDAMKEAHLAALRENDAQKPLATIFLNIDPFDPMNRDHQRAMDEARREAQAAGYRVDVRRGG